VIARNANVNKLAAAAVNVFEVGFMIFFFPLLQVGRNCPQSLGWRGIALKLTYPS